MTIKLIVGLANPGKKYINTRHNVGAWYVNTLAHYQNKSFTEEKQFCGYTSYFKHNNNYVRLLVPTTFMNNNGKSVAAIATFYHIEPEEILIAHDDLSFSPGYVRLKYKGSHGGHNGLKDIITCLGNKNNFYRLRIGIGHPGDKTKVVSFVLETPLEMEKKRIKNAINEAVLCTNMIIQQHFLKAMQQLHTIK
ncbi:aminoacyl-tRNA hydrolase [Candidatus Palibaumannia cicadellinicola]|uniref:Peptidyl-tRNA hydrolase n=1 Tax=Candidatus Palibaumannia cicadellinicola TaxID=186490 RepID=A0A0K2BKW6_9GAMM|nr:aminoacyl-tRNA hydrolase [Candidatus Baumannia cicadellinicola]AKZ65842.1 Peptidyl-tRNA hydrolase [Candidatus Baumannia cicadellinicola]